MIAVLVSGEPSAPESRVKTFFGLMVPSLRDIRRREPVLPPLLAAFVVSVGALLSLRPVFFGGASGEAADAVTAETMFWILIALAPVTTLVKAGLLAAFAWAALAFLSSGARLRPLLSVFLYGEALMALRGVFAGLYVHLTVALGGRETLAGPIGLAALVSPDRPLLAAAAQSVSLAHLAWVVFLSLALREVFSMSLRRSASLAVGLWAAVVAAAVARASLVN